MKEAKRKHIINNPTSDQGFSCEWKSPDSVTILPDNINKSLIYKFHDNYRWHEVSPEPYKKIDGNFANIVRHSIIGARGESCLFDLRYFEISEGGFSSLEKHQHEHVVMCVRGKGKVRIEDKMYELNPLDIVYISPHTPHQFTNESKEPFGFFCVVNRERGEPQELV